MNRDDFFKPRKLARSTVDVPNFGQMNFEELSESERTQFDLWLQPKGEYNAARSKNARLKLIALCARNDEWQPFLQDEDFDRMRETLGSRAMAVMAAECMKLSGLDSSDLAGELNGYAETNTGNSNSA